MELLVAGEPLGEEIAVVTLPRYGTGASGKQSRVGLDGRIPLFLSNNKGQVLDRLLVRRAEQRELLPILLLQRRKQCGAELHDLRGELARLLDEVHETVVRQRTTQIGEHRAKI